MAHIDDTRPVDGGEYSPAPGTPQTGTKAWVAAISTTLGAVLVALIGFVTGDETLADVTVAEWLYVSLAALGAGGITGAATYQVTNRPKAVR